MTAGQYEPIPIGNAQKPDVVQLNMGGRDGSRAEPVLLEKESTLQWPRDWRETHSGNDELLMKNVS